MAQRFSNRTEAGQAILSRLLPYRGRPDVLVLALPRGGVPVAYPVAQGLGAPLDVFLVRKLGVPGHSELAMGAIASGGGLVLNQDVIRQLGIPDQVLEAVARREAAELQRREALYRNGRPPIQDLRGRTVILVDDGLATGSSMRAAVAALRELSPARIVVAVPVAAREVCQQLREEVDEVVCVMTPDPFYAVGLWYDDFSQTSDDEVRQLLRQSQAARADLGASPDARGP